MKEVFSRDENIKLNISLLLSKVLNTGTRSSRFTG